MVDSHDSYDDRYRMLMDIYKANEKLNERADNKATALLTLLGALTSVAILLLTTDYVTLNFAFKLSLGVLILFSFISMLFLVHAIRPFFRKNSVTVHSNGVFFYKDILSCQTPEGYKKRVDEFEQDLYRFLDSMELSIFAVAQILRRKFNSLDYAVSSITVGIVLLVMTAIIGQLM